MNRERFETEAHRTAQEKLADIVRRTYKVALKPLPNAHYTLDYFAYDPNGCVGKAWVELKCRDIPFTKYPAIMLSAGKWRDGVTLSKETGLPFILIFEFKGGEIWQYDYNPKHVGTLFDQERRAQADTSKMLMPYGTQEVDKNGLWFDGKLYVSPGVWFEWGGRWVDDRDGHDAEPVVMIPTSLWNRVAIEPEPVRDTSFDKPGNVMVSMVEEPVNPDAMIKEEAPAKQDDHPF